VFLTNATSGIRSIAKYGNKSYATSFGEQLVKRLNSSLQLL
jgi:hypothetical protein